MRKTGYWVTLTLGCYCLLVAGRPGDTADSSRAQPKISAHAGKQHHHDYACQGEPTKETAGTRGVTLIGPTGGDVHF